MTPHQRAQGVVEAILKELPKIWMGMRQRHVLTTLITAALQDEIEACAKVADERAKWHKEGWDSDKVAHDELVECATAIRSRKERKPK